MADMDVASDTGNEAGPQGGTAPDVEVSPPTPAGDAEALVKLINILQPLGSAARHRTVDAAMIFLGEVGKPTSAAPWQPKSIISQEDDTEYTTAARRWMAHYDVSTEALERVYHLTGAEFVIHEVPGKSKREQVINAYILTGLGAYLQSDGGRQFDDAMARGFCATIGILDPTNHSKYLKDRHPEFSGDKSKGYVLSNPGLKRGAELIKGLVGSNRD
jgi:hypothetical protein